VNNYDSLVSNFIANEFYEVALIYAFLPMLLEDYKNCYYDYLLDEPINYLDACVEDNYIFPIGFTYA